MDDAETDARSLIVAMRIVRPMRAYAPCILDMSSSDTIWPRTLERGWIANIYDADDVVKESFGETDIKTLKSIYPILKDSVKKMKRLWNAIFMYEKSYYENYAGFKLVFLAIALEALFNIDPIEVSYKIANRASWFLGENKSERKEYFKQIKDAYDYRSKVVH